MENNNLFLNQISKKTTETNKRIERQTNEALRDYYARLKEETQLEEQKKNEATMSAARFSAGSIYMKNKQRQQQVKEMIEYNDKATTAVMTDILSKIINEALLLDTEEFSALNPSYKETVKETVKAFLENADLNEKFNDSRTIRIIENIMLNLPESNTGVYLKEEEIVDLVTDATPKQIEDDLSSLVTDVKKRVATIVSNDQEETQKIQDEIDEIVSISEAAKAKKVDPKKEDKKKDLEEDEEVDDEEEIEDDDDDDAYDDLADDEYLEYQKSINNKDGRKSRKKTEIQMDSDGGIKLIIREQFYKETPKKGILESLAFNEAIEMIQEGKEYNGELALANAVLYLTILETFNVTGLLTIGSKDYAKIIVASK